MHNQSILNRGTCIQILCCDWLVRLSYHTINHDTVLLDIAEPTKRKPAFTVWHLVCMMVSKIWFNESKLDIPNIIYKCDTKHKVVVQPALTTTFTGGEWLYIYRPFVVCFLLVRWPPRSQSTTTFNQPVFKSPYTSE